MKYAVVAAIGICLASTFSARAQSFSCPIGKQASCLDYNDKIVDRSAQCFDQFTCFPGGFLCKEDAEKMQAKARSMIEGYDALRNCIVRSSSMDDVENCVRKDNLRVY